MANSDVFVTFGGDTSALEAAAAVAKAQMQSLQREMAQVAREFNKAGETAESELGVRLKSLSNQMVATKGRMAELQAGAKTGGDAIKQMGERIGNAAYEYGPWSGAHVQLAQGLGVGLATGAREAGMAVTALGLAFGAAAAAAAVSLAVVASQVRGLRSLDDAARAAHVSMTALQSLNTAGAAVGLDAEQMNSEMASFAQKLREAQIAGGDLADFMQKNEISIKDAAGNMLPVQQVFGKVAELILSSTNEMDRLAALSKIGFSADTLRLIERQTDAVKAFSNSAASAHDTVLRRGMADGEALSAAWTSVWTDVKGGALSMSVSVLGSIGEIEHQGAAMFSGLGDQAAAAFHRISGDAKAAAASMDAAFEVQRGELLRSQKMALADGKNPYGDLSGNPFARKVATKSKSDAPTIHGLYDKDDDSKDKGKKGHDGAARLAQEAARDEIAAAKSVYDSKRTLYDEQAKLGIISEQQRIAQTRAALDEEVAAEKRALQDEIKTRNLKPEQVKSINNQILQLERQHQAELQKLRFHEVEDSVKNWNKMVDTMSSSLASSFSGMIEGTKNFRQAIQSLAQGVEREMVKMATDAVATWIKGQIASVVLSQTAEGQKTAAAAAGASARLGITASAAGAGVAAEKAAGAATITGDAAKAAAGAYASVAQIPVVGWIMAPAAAAAAFGAVEAFGAFDVGAWSIDKSQLAMVHKGEMIMTPGQSQGLRNVIGAAQGAYGGDGAGASAPASGGDTHVHLNVNAMDAASVKNWLSGNSRTIMKALDAAVKNGDHLGLRRLSAT